MAIGSVLHDSPRTRIARIPAPDGAGHLIRKELLGADAVQRARRERTVLERLAGIDGVLRPADVPAAEHELVLSDEGDVTLASLLRRGPLPVPDLLRLATVIAAVHARGVVHKDLNPANVMLSGDRPVLIDFELSNTAAEERPGFTHQSQITGTPAYLAPEQTGRTGRPVDQRSDLYSFGATLYEMATGRPPFGAGDPLRLLHDHLARRPQPAADLNPDLPVVPSDIIARLLEKEPDRRYQSAEGCAYDLARVGAGLAELGVRDFPARLLPPSRPVGRAADIARVRGCFDDAVTGEARGMLVSGPSGVGKTVLIDELRPIVTGAGGWFVTGRFDRYRQGSSADAVAQACRALGGCCWPSRTPSWLGCAPRSGPSWAPTPPCWPPSSRSSARCWTSGRSWPRASRRDAGPVVPGHADDAAGGGVAGPAAGDGARRPAVGRSDPDRVHRAAAR